MYCDTCYREMDLQWMLSLQCHALLVPHWMYTRHQFMICAQLQPSPTTYSILETFPGSYKDVLFLRKKVLITGTCSLSKFAKSILKNLELSLNLVHKEQFRIFGMLPFIHSSINNYVLCSSLDTFFSSFVILYTVNRATWMGISPSQECNLHTEQHKHRINTHPCLK
jgi:hypothetical protein